MQHVFSAYYLIFTYNCNIILTLFFLHATSYCYKNAHVSNLTHIQDEMMHLTFLQKEPFRLKSVILNISIKILSIREKLYNSYIYKLNYIIYTIKDIYINKYLTT